MDSSLFSSCNNKMERTSLDSSSSEDLDNLCIDHEIDDIDISVTPRKPHFLDYDAVPPPGFEDEEDSPLVALHGGSNNNNNNNNNSKIITPTSSSSNGGSSIGGGDGGIDYPGENVKVDKKYERDGEISDYELAASGITKRELTPQRKCSQINNNKNQNLNLNLNLNTNSNQKYTGGARKKKHFLDENPIPPDYMIDTEREHRSLDRNFERQNEYENINCSKYDRKHSLERESRLRKVKESNYTLSRFIENDIGPTCHGTWPVVERPSDNIINYSSMPPENVTNLGPKVECVYSLLSMLGSHDSVEMSKKFLELSRTTETCATLRRSGCIPLLVQMMHSDGDEGTRKRAAAALHNVVHCHPDDKAGRREAKVLRLIEQIMDYCNFLKSLLMSGGEAIADDSDRHPLAAISSLMKVSFDEEHRHAMCQLGALQAIASLVHLDHAVHGPKPEDQCCNSLRRYALMALTNLTFGDGNNKALLCANKEFMEALVAQLDSAPDDLLQVTASVLRNLSWRADINMKAVLNEIGTVTALAKAAMKNKNENTLKAILSALWNLSAHCSTNKTEFCSVEGALAFLVDMLTYEGPSKTLKIIENAGGILRNLSSHIAVREDYRKILRQRNCLGILLQQLKSESLTVVSNACGTLWNLSARCPEDQKYLWDNGAVPMLRSLIHSKHKMISEGSSAALKNLLNFRPGALNQNCMDPIAKAMGLRELPTLNARKQRALEQELNRNLAETCDNLDVVTPPKEKKEFTVPNNGAVNTTTNKNVMMSTRLTRSAVVSKSESRDSIVSAKSDSIYEKYRRGHSAPPLRETISKDKPLTSYNMHNNFIVKGEFDVEQVEQPIDYSAKYNIENTTAQKIVNDQITVSTRGRKDTQKPSDTRNYSTEYQETDLDQPTDFSLRYAENQAESDTDEKSTATAAEGSEIILILEDTVKCYQTEDTPYVISNAGSITDLRNSKHEEIVAPTKRIPHKTVSEITHNNYGFGTYTPEKPVNYCEEGTPGYFSRYESLSSLDESPPNCNNNVTKVKPEVLTEEPSTENKTADEIQITENTKMNTPPRSERQKASSSIPGAQALIPSNPNRNHPINSAQETPLMFSRRSSMDSLASAEPVTADDKSSVVSDFSRLASGVISPSELPDSPTQSMPQSPRRNSNSASGAAVFNSGSLPSTSQRLASTMTGTQQKQRLRSVFEDETSTFRVENTPAQFSCATSLSNLSLDDEPKIATDTIAKELVLLNQPPKEIAKCSSDIKTENPTEKNDSINKTLESCAASDGEEATNDDLLLATCINIGMNKGSSSSKLAMPHTSSNLQNHIEDRSETAAKEDSMAVGEDVIRRYCTEDTPALLSKVGSNSNLSALSISSTTNKAEAANHLSDESSNASDGGSDLLEQCIREGMQKTSISKQQKKNDCLSAVVTMSAEQSQLNAIPLKDPIAMLRRGGLPPYLPVGDEMSRFIVEDSPCNFSMISGLSNLTVGSGVAGPANINSLSGEDASRRPTEMINPEIKQIAEDSLSSISIESEDDTNLLSQAIAAGCNKSTKHHSSNKNLERVGPLIPTTSKQQRTGFHEANDSLSSVDSSDSNDYQAKSLFEQCIRTGMNKQSRKVEKSHPIQAQAINKVISPKRSQLPTFSHSSGTAVTATVTNMKTPMKMDRERQKERERKDEQLLRECINTGIAKSVRPVDQQTQIKPPTKHVRQVLAPTDFSQRLVTGASMEVREQQQQHQHQHQHQQQQSSVTNFSNVSKNGETTSVAVLEQHQLEIITSQSAPSTAPDVEMREPPEGINIVSKNQQLTQPLEVDPHRTIGNIRAQQQQSIIGCDLFETSQGSLNVSGDGFLLDQSNEYPALKSSNIDSIEDSVNESSFEMDVSNEFLIERDSSEEEITNSKKIMQNKHKDPDLMLKSVERLTQELVSTAEYLRTANLTSNNSTITGEIDFDNNSSTIHERKSDSNSNSNNTWNEDTCPNDVSFPSVSLTAPMIASFNDDETTISEGISAHQQQKNNDQKLNEKTLTNEANRPFYQSTDEKDCYNEILFLEETEPNNSQPNSLETETDTLVNDETDGNGSILNKQKNSDTYGNCIQFKVGGEVQQQTLNTNVHQFVSSGPLSFDSSTLTNSTMIAMEANKLANDLMKKMSDSTSSLDLDNIRPPSGMESLSISGCFDIPPPQSPQLSRLRKKSLPAALVARRALAGGQGQLYCGMSGSAESVNSSCNLENIKPPSLMDELLDSMISVESITSEIVDNNSIGMHTVVTTHYETAFSDIDENTTLQSCMDTLLPSDCDSKSGTPIPSDFSSVESTPRKGQKSLNNGAAAICPGIKRTLTPKQKRRIIKDRYKTYTIAADFVLKENYGVADDKQQQEEGEQSYQRPSIDNPLEFGEDDEIIRIEIEHEIVDDVNQNIDDYRLNETECNMNEETDKKTEEERQESLTAVSNRYKDKENLSGSVKRRILDPDRYKTRTIVYDCNADPGSTSSKSCSQQKIEHESLTSTEEENDELSIRILTKQFKFITPIESTSDQQQNNEKKQQTSVIPTINSLVRAKLLEEDKRTAAITTAESDYNSLECDQNSETESYGDQNYSSSKTDEEEISPKKNEIQKSKILKSNDKDSGTEINCSEDSMTPPETVKTVRGRKKPPYVSPYKKSVLSNGSSRTTSPRSQTGSTVYRANLATKNVSPEVKKTLTVKNVPRNQPIVAKTHVLVNKSNLTNKLNVTKSGKNSSVGAVSNGIGVTIKNTLKGKNLINKMMNGDVKLKEIRQPKKQMEIKSTVNDLTSGESIAGGLERQGTFVKDEPSNPEVPIVNSLPPSPAKVSKLPMMKTKSNGKLSNIPKSPVKTFTSTSKMRPPSTSQKNTDDGKSKIQTKQSSTVNFKQPRSGMAGSGTTNAVDTGPPKRKPIMIGIRKSSATVVPPQRSNSNATIRTTPTISSLRTNFPSTTPPSRSNSNLTSGGNGKTSSTTSGVTSRIAGIWKKTDDTKTTTRTAGSKLGIGGTSVGVGGKPPLSGSGAGNGSGNKRNKLIRSSTFDSDSTINGTVIEETITATTITSTENENLQEKYICKIDEIPPSSLSSSPQQSLSPPLIPICNTGTFLIRRSKNIKQNLLMAKEDESTKMTTTKLKEKQNYGHDNDDISTKATTETNC